ncbi:MAG: hypothetical protein LKK19_03920 [Bacteroidales bacterium]|jgi:hypothetical protein|nr:hypothetical protein [Bacteroidales bacterium]MCI2121834.1 hypothetical protein [Bacteroidales bacterium]MCI2146044.1 hypothetical protein [Bacteroidales bacterium]
MKRFIVAVLTFLMTVTAVSAQVEIRDYVSCLGAQAGVRVLDSSDSTSSVSSLVGIHSDFYMNSTLRARVLANCVLGDSFALGVCADGHVLINLVDALDVYPLAGISTSFHPGVGNWFSVGIDAGVGVEYNFNETIGAFAESKYQKLWISPMSGFESYLGFTYTF